MNYHFWIIGCQMNVADSERIARVLNEHGHRPVPHAENADLVLLTGCRAPGRGPPVGGAGSPGALKQARPELVVAVTGCVTDGNVDAFLKRATGVDLYVDPRRPEALLEHLARGG